MTNIPSGVVRRLENSLGRVVASYINAQLRSNLAREQCLRWAQLANRYPRFLADVDEDILTPTEYAQSIYCGRRSGIGQTIMESGRWEGLLSRTILACLKSGDVAIDVGANIGYDTLLMSKAVGPRGLVYAFEPEPQNLGLLLKNVGIAAHRNIVVSSFALSDSWSIAQISISDAYSRGKPNLRPNQSGQTQPVLAVRLDSVLTLSGDQRISFLKIDIEGYEFRAIRGLGDLLKRVDMLTCEVNHQFLAQCGTSALELFDYLRAGGFAHSYCTEPVGDDRWVRSDQSFLVKTDKGQHFDALFCREEPASLAALVGSA